MIAAFGRALTIIALCLSLGLHWLALQSVAWTAMLVSNACHVPLTQAVAATFDGTHPCHLCHAVAEGKKTEKKSQVFPTITRIDLICVTRTVTSLSPWVRYDYETLPVSVSDFPQTPPSPPPRGLDA
jgi:hypothetical protein